MVQYDYNGDSNDANFVNSSSSWFVRSGSVHRNNSPVGAGTYAYTKGAGAAEDHTGSRVVVTILS